MDGLAVRFDALRIKTSKQNAQQCSQHYGHLPW
jgi:hypothetical protein